MSPSVLVRKRDGTVRYCIHLRKVNKVSFKDRYPLSKISKCIDALAGWEWEYFSCLDMANGYYQIKMEGEDRDKTAFVTKYGQFVFNRMLFGLSNAPGTFCRALGLILGGLPWESVVSFLDIVILGGILRINMGKIREHTNQMREKCVELHNSRNGYIYFVILFQDFTTGQFYSRKAKT